MTHVCDHRAVARWDDGRLYGQASILAFLVALFCFGALFLTAEAQAQNQNVRFWSGPGGNFDFYVLSLSWSPTFCAQEGQDRGSAQCEAGRRIGFTVHGLWPQYSAGYPSNCPAGERAVPRATLDGIRDLFPDSGLARYQWRKHGSCSGADPDSYFRATRQAAGKVRIPDRLKNMSGPLSMQAIDIERAFSAANPGLRSDMMRVMCRRGALQEVRVCFDRDIRGFASCGKVERGNCGFTDVAIKPAR